MARRSGPRESRTPRRVVAVIVALLGFVIALVFVRLALDWSDSLPYEGAVTGTRYMIFMLVAGALIAVSVGTAIALWIRAGRR